MAVSGMVHAAPLSGFQPSWQTTSGGPCDSRAAMRRAPPAVDFSSSCSPPFFRIFRPSSVQCRGAGESSSSAEPDSSSKASGSSGRANSRKGNPSGGGEFRDTRIHWGDSEEGWLGTDDGPSSSFSSGSSSSSGNRRSESGVSEALRELLSQAKDSHYRYLGISTNADLDEIKAAYRKLSKEYHPDSTSLPLEIAAQKFMKLKEAYTVLSNEADRKYYDWKLAQQLVSSEQLVAEKAWSQSGLGTGNYSKPQRYVEPVDALAPGDNLPLSDQAQTALAFDLFAAIVSIATIIYVSIRDGQQQ